MDADDRPYGNIPKELILQSFAIDGTDVNAHDIITRLKFISKIKKEEKLAVSGGMRYIISDTLWNGILRTFGYSVGSKKDTLAFIKDTTDKGLELARRCFASNDEFHSKIAYLIIESLREADTGINNIIETYNNNRWFVSEIETFRQILDAKINSLVAH